MIGTTLRHYTIESLLGKGGMGEVYRARDTRLGRAVALKVLPSEFIADLARRRRFLQEARAASAVNHPAIAQVYDVDEVDGVVFLALELVEGKTLRALIQNRELDVLGALEIAEQLASGLARAHEGGIVHRDIKPENVMLTPDGHAKILDFGLAKLLETSPELDAGAASKMETLARTHAGMIMGTLRYMSPEQARGVPIDHRTDIFSLGVVLYEMVTGQSPFVGETPLDTLHAIAYEETKPVTALRPNVPAAVQRVVSRCLRKQPKDRYSDARELLADLKLAQKEVESGATSTPPLAERLRAWVPTPGAAHQIHPLAPVAIFAALLLATWAWAREVWPSLFILAIASLFVYRRIRNRRYYMLRKLRGQLRKLPDVRLAVADGSRLTLVADNALAKTYVRANAIVNDMNAKMLYGDAFTLVIRESASEEEVRALLSGPGVLFVREDRKT